MEVAQINVNGVYAKVAHRKPVTKGMVGAKVRILFTDAVWKGLHKTVVFSGICTKDVEMEGDTAAIPQEVVASADVQLKVGVYGTDAGKNLVIPTLWASLGMVKDGADPSGDPAADPAYAPWMSIRKDMGDLNDLLTEAKTSLVAAINEIASKYGEAMDESTVWKIVDDYITKYPPANGTDGLTPYIGLNGNWYLGEVDTGVRAQGVPGVDGRSAYDYAQEGGYAGTEEEFAAKLADDSVDPEQVNSLIDTRMRSVTSFGAVGDGAADDTEAFQTALAQNRVVNVPGGTYKLSGELKVGNHSELRLSQDTILDFTQTAGNCITLGLMSTVTGNHGTVQVPYAFSGNVVNADTATTELDEIYTLEPWSKWDPQWKYGRYVTDLSITKPDSRGFHYSVNGETNGTAVSIRADGSDDTHYMWGLHFSGLRIAGAFKYGIHTVCKNEAWLHEMRIDAFIDACEIGVCLENSSNAYISAIVQPRAALSADDKKTTYAKHGFKLVNSKNVDLSGSRVWDWNEQNTLWTAGGEYQMVGLMGNCRGLILNAFQYYETSSDIRSQIYTDTPANLEQMTILQEPFTRWFKPKDGEPYFYDGENTKRLALKEDFNEFFQTERIQAYTDVKRPYLADVYDNNGTMTACNGNMYIEPREFSVGDVVRIRGLDFTSNYPGKAFINLYHKDSGDYKGIINMASLTAESYTGTTYNNEATYEWNNETKTLTFAFNGSYASAMLASYKYSFSGGYASGYTADEVIMTVNEEIEFEQVGCLSDSIYAQKAILKSPGGKVFELTVAEDGTLSTVEFAE